MSLSMLSGHELEAGMGQFYLLSPGLRAAWQKFSQLCQKKAYTRSYHFLCSIQNFCVRTRQSSHKQIQLSFCLPLSMKSHASDYLMSYTLPEFFAHATATGLAEHLHTPNPPTEDTAAYRQTRLICYRRIFLWAPFVLILYSSCDFCYRKRVACSVPQWEILLLQAEKQRLCRTKCHNSSCQLDSGTAINTKQS